MSGRRFHYELEAAHVQAGHRLEEATQRVAAARAVLHRDEQTRAGLLDEIERLGRSTTAASHVRLDPQLSMALTRHLVGLRQRVAAIEQAIHDKQQQLTRLTDVMRARKIDQESYERHRAQRLQDHTRALLVRAAVEADQDWLARSAWREDQTVDGREAALSPGEFA